MPAIPAWRISRSTRLRLQRMPSPKRSSACTRGEPYERRELVELRRKLRVAEMEVEILRRAAAYFAKESNALPK